MRTEKINVYTFNELSDDAKKVARDWWLRDYDYTCHGEVIKSIEAFCKPFGVRLVYWEIDGYSPFRFKLQFPDELATVSPNDVDPEKMPTGYYMDYTLSHAFLDALNHRKNTEDAIRAAVHAAMRDWQADIQYQMSDECVDDLLEANGYEFTESGDLFKREAA
jgi:hypothetical protein